LKTPTKTVSDKFVSPVIHEESLTDAEAPFTRYNLLSNRTGCIVYTNI